MVNRIRTYTFRTVDGETFNASAIQAKVKLENKFGPVRMLAQYGSNYGFTVYRESDRKFLAHTIQ